MSVFPFTLSLIQTVQNPTSELTRDQRVQIAYAAEDVLLPFLPNGTVMFLHMDNGNRRKSFWYEVTVSF